MLIIKLNDKKKMISFFNINSKTKLKQNITQYYRHYLSIYMNSFMGEWKIFSMKQRKLTISH